MEDGQYPMSYSLTICPFTVYCNSVSTLYIHYTGTHTHVTLLHTIADQASLMFNNESKVELLGVINKLIVCSYSRISSLVVCCIVQSNH